MTYKISEISARSPDMSEEDFDAFVEDIRANGQLVPIWIRGSEVIDGRKRLAACQRLGVEPKVININPEQDAEAVARALNLLRTHYSSSQRAMFAAERANATKAHTAAFRTSTKNSVRGEVTTAIDAAKEHGVAESYVIAAKKVRRDGAPEVSEAVKRGTLTLHAAEQIVDAVPIAEQPAFVDRVVESAKGKSRHTPVAKLLDEAHDVRRDRAQPKPSHEQFARAVTSMEVLADVITKNVDAASRDARRKSLLESLRDIRTILTRAINAMEIAA